MNEKDETIKTNDKTSTLNLFTLNKKVNELQKEVEILKKVLQNRR